MPGESGEPSVTTLVCFTSPFAREAAGALGTRHSPRPLFFWANGSCKTQALAPRECGVVFDEYDRATLSLVIARLDRATQYSRDVDDKIERPRRTGSSGQAGR